MYFSGVSEECMSSIIFAMKTLNTGTNILEMKAWNGTGSSPMK
jgi:hypothetical protein